MVDDMNGSSEVVPAWQYRDAQPYQPSNDAAVTHGGYSPGRWKPRAAAIKAALLSAPFLEYLNEPRFALGVDDLCEAQAIGDALGDWLYAQGIEASAAEVI